MNREEWLEVRRKGIGSSDAAGCCGLSRWSSPLSVYLSKVGLLPQVDKPETRWGLKLEDTVAAAYEEETGLQLIAPDLLYHHDQYPWMLCTPDRIVSGQDRVVELKTARSGDHWGEPGTDEVPQDYLLQVNHQMAVLNIDVADVAVLIAGSDFRIYTVRRSEEIVTRLIEIEAEVWHRVQMLAPPEADWEHPETPRLVQLLHQPQEGKSVCLPSHVCELVDLYEALGRSASEAEKHRDLIKARLADAMQDAEVGILPDGRMVSRRSVSRKGYTVEAKNYIETRIKKAKVLA